MSTELDIIKYAEKQGEVISLWCRGMKLVDIMKTTGVRKQELDRMLADYKDFALQDRVLREMSRETLIKTRQHYDDLIEQMYEAVQTAEENDDYKVKLDGLKKIADAENQRVAFMQKAGLLVDDELGQQLIEQERKQQVLVDILREISKKHPDIGLEIAGKLSKVTGVIEGVPAERMDQ